MSTKEAEGTDKTKLRPNTIMICGGLAAVLFQSSNLLSRYVEKDTANLIFLLTLPFLPVAIVLMGWSVYRFAHTGKW